MPEKIKNLTKKSTTKKLTRKFYYPRNNYRTAVKILKYLELHKLPTILMISNATVNNHHDTKITMEFLKKLGYCKEYKIVTNPDHKCMNCNESSQYVVDSDSIQSSLEILEKNHQVMIKNKSKVDFKRKNYFPYEKDHVLGRLVWMECKKCKKHDTSANEILFKTNQNRLWSLTEKGKRLFLVLYKDEKLTKFLKQNLEIKIFELIYALKQSAEKSPVKNLISKLNRTIYDDDDVIFEKILSEWYEINFKKIMTTKYSDSLHQPLIDYEIKYHWDYLGKTIHMSHKN
ncbi:MAG: hypothetical protein ACW9W4_10545 [Candidatus Nitrosopumilus sp. bin_7KS]